MHGIKKDKDIAEREKQNAIMKKKIDVYQKILELGQKKKENKEYDEEALKITGELLGFNGDCYTMWNYRRKTLLHLFSLPPPVDGDNNNNVDNNNENGENKERINPVEKKLLERELLFTQNTLQKNTKSYWCWNQREWATSRLHKYQLCDWVTELALCKKFLSYDSRNFHCWNYRRYVTRMSNVSNEDEWQYSTSLIEENFSNYSAWHQRSKLLPLIHTDRAAFLQAIDDELELIQNAFYTEPNDQSAWFYHRWLVNQNPTKEVIARELDRCQQLIDAAETPSERKWPKLTTVLLMKLLPPNEQPTDEMNRLLHELSEEDAYHHQYYQSMLTK